VVVLPPLLHLHIPGDHSMNLRFGRKSFQQNSCSKITDKMSLKNRAIRRVCANLPPNMQPNPFFA
jgi:hypothetical protein